MKTIQDIKAIVVDLDRTLLHTDKSISSYTIAVLEACRNRGMQIMVATARPLRTTIPYCAKIPFDAMVVSNGARIICGDRRTEYGIDIACAERLLHALQNHPALRITVENGDRAYSNLKIEDYETIITENLADVANAEGVLKILVHLDQEDTLEIVKQELTDDLYYTIANGYLLQIMNKSATKWNGIRAMLKIANCSPEEAVYFGDDHDDVEPIRLCGTGVAVSNGIEEVKAVADYIAQSNDDDGVARFIEEMILNKVK